MSRWSEPTTLEGTYYRVARDAVLDSVAGSVSGQDAGLVRRGSQFAGAQRPVVNTLAPLESMKWTGQVFIGEELIVVNGSPASLACGYLGALPTYNSAVIQ